MLALRRRLRGSPVRRSSISSSISSSTIDHWTALRMRLWNARGNTGIDWGGTMDVQSTDGYLIGLMIARVRVMQSVARLVMRI
jgi:hypothetical protein